jgi:hypothetical protein
MSYSQSEEYISIHQENIIDDLLRSNRHRFYIDHNELVSLEEESFNSSITYDRAQEIIDYLNDNKIETDLDKQFDNLNL